MSEEKDEGRITVEQQDVEVTELDDFLARAEDLKNEGRFQEAEAILQDAISRFPDSPLPHHALGVVYLDRLRQDYEHLELWEDLSDDEAMFDLAVAETQAALEADSSFIPALNNLGRLFAYRGWYVDAIRQWEMSLSISSDQPVVREDLTRAKAMVE